MVSFSNRNTCGLQNIFKPSHLNPFHVPASSPCTKCLSNNMVEVHKRCPVAPAQSSLLCNSLHFTGALEKGTRNTALDNLGIVNEWKNFLSYTAGWHLACIPRHGCFDSTMAENPARHWVIVIKPQGRLWPQGVSSNLGMSTSHLRLARRTPLFGKDSVPWLRAKP